MKRDVEDALKQAQEDTYPTEANLYDDIYVQKPYFVRGVDVHETAKVVE